MSEPPNWLVASIAAFVLGGFVALGRMILLVHR